MQTLPAQHADANPRRTSVLSEGVNGAGWRACLCPFTYFLWDRDVMFQIEAGKIQTEKGKDMHVVLQNMELCTIFLFKPNFERGKRQWREK